jgi:hypothetical protein
METLVFLGKDCQGGVSTALKGQLQGVEADLQQTWQNEGAPGTFQDWVDIREPHHAAHQGGNHTLGNALDINYQTNPYIATRSARANGGVAYGGEAPPPPGITRVRVWATAVYDRATAFFISENMVANVSGRGASETTDDVYTRFSNASTALATYLQLAFQPRPPPSTGLAPALTRTPVTDAVSADITTLLAGIPTSERLDETTARANVGAVITSGFPPFGNTHPNWPGDVDFWLQQILRDYEVVRIPMEIGPSSLSPGKTRSPVNGFLDLRREIVVSLCDVGHLRWGASDFGNDESGDVQHFDTAPVINSQTGGADEIRIDLQTVAGVQQSLASLPNANYDPGKVDNIAAPGGTTETAAKAFMSDRQQPFGGIDDDTLRDELTAALQEAAVPF